MRRTFAMSLGLSGVLAGSAAAQFGSPPPATPMQPATAPFGNPTPMTPPPTGSYVPPVGGLQPMNSFRPVGSAAATAPVQPIEIPLALGPNHPMCVKAEDGTYFLCVRSFSRPHNPDPSDKGYTVKELAEALAAEIQETHKTRVYLYELISDEKKAQIKAQTDARQRAAEFAAALEQYKQRGALQGADFVDFDRKVKYQTFQYRDQVAVLIGGYRTEDEAVKALKVVKQWAPPKDRRLMDAGSISSRDANGKPVIEASLLNPYPQSMVVQNPMIVKQVNTQPMGPDPFIAKLNEGRPYSLLTAKKNWTLAVKSFTAPVHYTSKDEEKPAMKLFGSSKDADVLRAGAEQAEALVKALRDMKDKSGTPMNLQAFVLHTRTASLVTVGDYETPNDPELLATQRILTKLTFNLSRDEKGQQITGSSQKMFGDMIQPVPIPRREVKSAGQ